MLTQINNSIGQLPFTNCPTNATITLIHLQQLTPTTIVGRMTLQGNPRSIDLYLIGRLDDTQQRKARLTLTLRPPKGLQVTMPDPTSLFHSGVLTSASLQFGVLGLDLQDMSGEDWYIRTCEQHLQSNKPMPFGFDACNYFTDYVNAQQNRPRTRYNPNWYAPHIYAK